MTCDQWCGRDSLLTIRIVITRPQRVVFAISLLRLWGAGAEGSQLGPLLTHRIDLRLEDLDQVDRNTRENHSDTLDTLHDSA